LKKLSPNASTYTAVGLVALGLIMIYLGWNGAAGEDAGIDLRAQFPYLLSGGIFGLALIGAGLALVLVFEHRRDARELGRQVERLTAAVERLEQAALARSLAEVETAPVPAPAPMLASAPPPAAPPFEPAR
jgi:hypothetical protein